MSNEKDENDQGAQELLYWALAFVGLIAIRQLWTERLRPWVETTWGQLRAGELVNLPVVGRVEHADVVGISALTAIFLATIVIVVVKRSRRKPIKTAVGRSKD